MVITHKGRQRLFFFGVAFASFMVNVDTYIVNISLPTIAREFEVSTAAVSWVVLSYQLAVTCLLIVFGRLGDRFGLKRVFLCGFGIFTFGSLLCAVSQTLLILVVSRFLQGIGASVLYALTPAMIPAYLPEKDRGPAFGVLATVTALGITVGTPLGGLITNYFSWPWIFLVNVPTGIAAILLCSRVIPTPPDAPVTKRERFDLAGALLSITGSLAFVFALSESRQTGWSSPAVMVALAVAVFSLTAFVLHERRAVAPLLDLSLFRNPIFCFGNLASALAYAFLAGNNFVMPFYLESVQGLKPAQAGFVFMTYSLVYMAMGPLTGWLSRRIHARTICTAAMLLGTVATLTFSGLLGQATLPVVLVYFACMGVTFASFCTANNSAVMSSAPQGKEGIVAGVFRMIMRFGMVLGVCIFEAFFAWRGEGSAAAEAPTSHALPPEAVASGVSTVLVVGSVVCLLAAFFSYLATPRRDVGKQAPPG